MNFKPVSVSGGFWTGSSAVTDLLAEHASCSTFSHEFTAFSNGQMFSDLRDFLSMGAIAKPAVAAAVWRFQKFNSGEPRIINALLRRLCVGVGIFPRSLFVSRIGMSRRLGSQYGEACRDFADYVLKGLENGSLDHEILTEGIQRILYTAAQATRRPGLPEDETIAAFDQLIAPPYIESTLEFVPNLKLIVVDRDWRDQYADLRNQVPRMVRVKSALSVRAWGEEMGREDADPVKFFVRIRNKIDSTKRAIAAGSQPNVLWINFEDLVKEPENTAHEIFGFLGVSGDGWRRNTHFFPARSSRNIGRWKSSPYTAEIERLARILPD